jgi:hypothetical protein
MTVRIGVVADSSFGSTARIWGGDRQFVWVTQCVDASQIEHTNKKRGKKVTKHTSLKHMPYCGPLWTFK